MDQRFTRNRGAATEDEWLTAMEVIFWSLSMTNDDLRMMTTPTCLLGVVAKRWQSEV